jgi:hypothetical protein
MHYAMNRDKIKFLNNSVVETVDIAAQSTTAAEQTGDEDY